MSNSNQGRFNRRSFIALAGASLAVTTIGCGNQAASLDPDGNNDDGGVLAQDGGDQGLAWGSVPALIFTVGVPTEVDLRAFLTDPGQSAVIQLDMALPPGLSLVDGVIIGTPSGEAVARDYQATANDDQ